MPKNIYLVRHGQSESNALQTQQGPDSKLTERGRAQAQCVAKRFESIPVQKIITSSLKRAQETAEIIGSHLDISVESSDAFVERKKPTRIMGIKSSDPDAAQVMEKMYHGWRTGEGPYEDEETFDEFLGRLKALYNLPRERSEEDILIVSHGFFIRSFLAYALLEEAFTADILLSFVPRVKTDNTGISHFIYDEANEEAPLRLAQWNDSAHLGEIEE